MLASRFCAALVFLFTTVAVLTFTASNAAGALPNGRIDSPRDASTVQPREIVVIRTASKQKPLVAVRSLNEGSQWWVQDDGVFRGAYRYEVPVSFGNEQTPPGTCFQITVLAAKDAVAARRVRAGDHWETLPEGISYGHVITVFTNNDAATEPHEVQADFGHKLAVKTPQHAADKHAANKHAANQVAVNRPAINHPAINRPAINRPVANRARANHANLFADLVSPRPGSAVNTLQSVTWKLSMSTADRPRLLVRAAQENSSWWVQESLRTSADGKQVSGTARIGNAHTTTGTEFLLVLVRPKTAEASESLRTGNVLSDLSDFVCSPTFKLVAR